MATTWARATILLAGLSATPLLASCASMPATSVFAPARIDANSPVAQDVARATTTEHDFPTFGSIPATPTDIRAPAAWKGSVSAIQADKSAVDAQLAANPPGPVDTPAFVASLQSEIDKQIASPASPSAKADAEAFARALRERAKPPSPRP